MGEAKRRKEADPNHGTQPQFPKSRGLVISPPMTISGTNLYIKSTSIDPVELRFSLLFWDKLVWPSSRAINIASGPDEQFLESSGILTRPEYTFDGYASESIARSQIQAFLDLDRREPDSWAIAQGENSLLIKDNNFQHQSGIQIELARAIPIPQHDVPLAEVLEFKEHRKDQLVNLRSHLDKIGKEINSAGNSEDELRKQILAIDLACSDLLKVGKEWQFPFYISNLKTSFTLGSRSVVAAIATWGYFGTRIGLEAATAAAITAGVASSFELKADIGYRPLRMPQNPFKYAHYAHKELL